MTSNEMCRAVPFFPAVINNRCMPNACSCLRDGYISFWNVDMVLVCTEKSNKRSHWEKPLREAIERSLWEKPLREAIERNHWYFPTPVWDELRTKERPRRFSTLGTMDTVRKKTVDTRHTLTQFGDWSVPSRPLSSACAQGTVVWVPIWRGLAFQTLPCVSADKMTKPQTTSFSPVQHIPRDVSYMATRCWSGDQAVGLGRRPLPGIWICGINRTEDLTCTAVDRWRRRRKNRGEDGLAGDLLVFVTLVCKGQSRYF